MIFLIVRFPHFIRAFGINIVWQQGLLLLLEIILISMERPQLVLYFFLHSFQVPAFFASGCGTHYPIFNVCFPKKTGLVTGVSTSRLIVKY